jgi:hypothetical protein
MLLSVVCTWTGPFEIDNGATLGDTNYNLISMQKHISNFTRIINDTVAQTLIVTLIYRELFYVI